MEDEARLKMHPSVAKVAEFMCRELLQEERTAVAEALAIAAPAIWGPSKREWKIPAPMEFGIHIRADKEPATVGALT